MDDDFVELSEAIDVLREQLWNARELGRGRSPRFSVGRVEVEFCVEARREAGAEGGVRFGVFTLGAHGSVASTSTHRLRLELTPLTDGGDSWEVHGTVVEPPSQ